MLHHVVMARTEISRPATANIPPFGLRLQPELKERVEAAAKASGRSMNAEIVARLQASFEERVPELDDWELHVEERLVELQRDVVEEDLMVQRVYKDALWARVRALEISDPAGQLDRAVKVAQGVDSDLVDLVERLYSLQAKIRTIEAKFSANSRKRYERIDRIVTPQVEAEFKASHARQDRLWEEFKALGGTTEEIEVAKAAETARQDKVFTLRASRVRMSDLPSDTGEDILPALDALLRGAQASDPAPPPKARKRMP
ncbi:Arc family DNA-binding protein [Pseudorhodoferax sp.]|uniref:Arc family DNA-binding protein n=1 Tax=Pseudorhodoferax sp. TaxID=1993553 RepID=UPI0039E5AC02